MMASHSITISQLRDTRRLKTWLRRGITVRLTDRGRFIGRIVPEPTSLQRRKNPQWPDFAARSRAIFGNRVIPGSDLLIAERGRW